MLTSERLAHCLCSAQARVMRYALGVRQMALGVPGGGAHGEGSACAQATDVVFAWSGTVHAAIGDPATQQLLGAQACIQREAAT